MVAYGHRPIALAGHELKNTNLARQILHDILLDATKEVRPQAFMQLFHKLFREVRILLFHRVQIVPVIRIEVAEQIENLPNVVVDGSAGHENTMYGVEFPQLLE